MTNAPLEEFGYRDVRGIRVASVLHRGQPDRRSLVVMTHGFRSSKIGPSRYFVDVARGLASKGISSFRFDQPGSGDSEGAFEDSSFITWIDTIELVVSAFHAEGYAVALLGQSMGGRAAVAAAAKLRDVLEGLALWSPGPMLNANSWEPDGEWLEEEGQRVRSTFWQEAATIDFLDLYQSLTCPVYMIFGSADQLIPLEEMRAVEAACKNGDQIKVIEGLPHSAWPEPPRLSILRETRQQLESWFVERTN